MTIFDLLALAAVFLSALSGFNRGAVAELLGLFNLALAAMATIAFLPATAPIVRHFIHAGWLSAVVAAAITFVAFFLLLRILAATLTNSINRGLLSGANRFGGLMFGALRGVLLISLFALVFNRATPDELKPHWITGAMTYPLASEAGQALGAALPKRLDMTGGLGGRLTNSITEESRKSDDEVNTVNETVPGEAIAPASVPPPDQHNHPTSERAKPNDHGYTKHARDSVDALVERSK